MTKLCTLYGVAIYADTKDAQELNLINNYLKNSTGMFTNLPNEITGAYYREQGTLKFYIKNTILVVCLLALPFLLADLIFGAETVTNFIADLLGSLMG